MTLLNPKEPCEENFFQEAIEIDELTTLYYFEFNDSFVDTIESHEMWEMVYIDRGECDIFADDRTFRLDQGQIYFHKPYERHMLKLPKGSTPNVFIVIFRSKSVAMRFFERLKLDASLAVKQTISAIIHEAYSTYEAPFNCPFNRRLEPKKENRLWGGMQSIRLRFQLMLIELIRESNHFRVPQKVLCDKDIVEDETCRCVIEYLERHVYEKLNTDALCKELSFSKSYISKRFNAVCGCSILEYFNTMKIAEAKRLIRESGKNFFEISEMLMFANSHYFSTCFKKQVGMTPSQFKKSCC